MNLAKQVRADIASVSPGDQGAAAFRAIRAIPGTSRRSTARLHDFARGYPFDAEREHYLVHITTGTHVAQICMFLLTEARYLPGRAAADLAAQAADARATPGSLPLIDLDLSRYDQIARALRARAAARARRLPEVAASRRATPPSTA